MLKINLKLAVYFSILAFSSLSYLKAYKDAPFSSLNLSKDDITLRFYNKFSFIL